MFDAVTEDGGVRCGVLDDEADEWLAATDVMPIAEARCCLARLQKAIHEAKHGSTDQAGQR